MLKDAVYNSIRTRIITQKMRPGSRINEKQLMDEYEIGKTPLREVFIRLQFEGLIRRFPRSGTIVAPIDFAELREAAEIRVALEGLVAELAAKYITEPQLLALKKHISELSKTAREGILDKYIITETELHFLLYDATRNSKLKQLIAEQQGLFSRMWFSIDRSTSDLALQVKDWVDLCAALEKKDSALAVKINTGHFTTFYNHLKSFF